MNMNFTKLLIVSVFLLGIVGSAYAAPRAEAHEISGAAAFFRPIGSGSGAVTGDAIYGYSISDPLQVGLRQSYTLIFNDETSDVWNAVTAPYFNYHFLDCDFLGRDTLVPYLGAFLGAVWNDDDFTGTTGPQGGIKTYLSPSSFLALNYRYEWFFDEIGDADETQDSNHIVTLGLGHTWGGVARRN